jgi:hypothetical protein
MSIKRTKSLLLALLSLVLLTISTQSALAHERIEVGPYAIVVGWEEEPVIVGERNALVFEVTEDDSPVTGVESSLDIEILYGGRSFRTNINPTVEPGTYTADIFPTVRGQYEVRLFGSIGETAVDMTVEPEEVLSASRLQFPEAQPDPIELQNNIDELKQQLQAARTLAYVGIGVGIIAIILAAVALMRRRTI